MVEIVTSSWFTKLPAGHVRIGISRGVPTSIEAKLYPKLNPGWWFKSCATPQEYIERYYSEVLAKLNPGSVVEDLAGLTNGGTACLVCFERLGGGRWCHRSLVSVWLHDALGLEVRELGSEGFGWQHPLAPTLPNPEGHPSR